MEAEWEALAEKLELDLDSCRSPGAPISRGSQKPRRLQKCPAVRLGQQVASHGLLLRRLLGGEEPSPEQQKKS